LTHGHFDHVGVLRELADEWDVPVFAHPLEMPYLDGRANYPPPDPTVGGFMAQMSRFFPRKGINVGHRLRPLLIDGTIPHMPGWRVVHTPGHTSGHVSWFRDEDRTLIAGDAVITIDQEHITKLVSQVRMFHGPPHYFTHDWNAAAESIHKLSHLRPRTVAAGHGLPMSGADVADKLTDFALRFTPPRHGRYVNDPALADENGIYYTPPAPADRVPMYAAGIALAAAGLLLASSRRRASRNNVTYDSSEMMPLIDAGASSATANALEPGDRVPEEYMEYDIFGRKPSR
jgi:glyoxylase-like metal-dependent hydrolase (beta-lactamase superfamily II)